MAKKGMVKKLLFVGVGLVILFVIAVMGVFFNINAIAKAAIEGAMSYVLDVDVTLDRVEVNLKEGSVDLYEFKVGNPAGYKEPEAFSFAHANVTLDPSSIRSDTLVFKVMSMKQPSTTLEVKDLKNNNIKQLIDNASRLSSGGGLDTKAPSSKEAKQAGMQVKIDTILVENSVVTLASPLVPKSVKFSLPTVEIHDIGTGPTGATVAEAVTDFFKKILIETTKASRGKIPPDVLAALNTSVEEIRGEINQVKDALEKNTKAMIEGMKEAPAKAVEGIKEDAEKVKEDLGKGLKGLLNR